jgi:hypothetical protein
MVVGVTAMMAHLIHHRRTKMKTLVMLVDKKEETTMMVKTGSSDNGNSLPDDSNNPLPDENTGTDQQIQCLSGEHFDENTNLCVQDTSDQQQIQGLMVSNSGEECPEGTYLDPETEYCFEDVPLSASESNRL